MTARHLSFFFSGLWVAFALFPGMTHAAQDIAANAEDTFGTLEVSDVLPPSDMQDFSDPQATDTVVPESESGIAANAEGAFSALDTGDESLPTAEDFTKAQGTESNVLPVAEILDYQHVPLTQTSDIEPTPPDGSLSSSSPPVTQPTNTASVPQTFGGPLRMELGLGWSLSSDPAYGLAGIIALKLRPSAHAPVLLGVEGSTALLLWSDVFGFHVMGDLTLSIYPSRYFYFMLGGGINFLKFIREEEPLRNGATDFSSHLDEPLRNEAFGFNALLAIGMEFPITDPFRIGFQLRAQGGMYADNLFGMVASYLVFSFF